MSLRSCSYSSRFRRRIGPRPFFATSARSAAWSSGASCRNIAARSAAASSTPLGGISPFSMRSWTRTQRSRVTRLPRSKLKEAKSSPPLAAAPEWQPRHVLSIAVFRPDGICAKAGSKRLPAMISALILYATNKDLTLKWTGEWIGRGGRDAIPPQAASLPHLAAQLHTQRTATGTRSPPCHKATQSSSPPHFWAVRQATPQTYRVERQAL